MRAGSADFFELQEEARRTTRRLVPLYVLAVAAVSVAVAAVAGLAYAPWLLFWGGPFEGPVRVDYGNLILSYFSVVVHGVPRAFYGAVAGATLAVIVAASLSRTLQLRAGGEAVAELLGARMLDRPGATATEARLLNIVEEMAIASGVAVPPVYVLDDEHGINALAAGYAPNDAVLVVTRPAMLKLTRDELQGVIAHEFSHVLNGDMRLNVRLLGLLYGVVCVGQIGQHLVRSAVSGAIGVAREKQMIGVPQLVAGLILAGVGHVGLLAAQLIKSAVARQREFLADAASVQFTRNPDGIAGALDSTRSLRLGTRVQNLHAEEMSHMFFSQAVPTWLGHAFATHPTIDERIRRVHPRFRVDDYRASREGLHQQNAVAIIDGSGNVVRTVHGKDRALAASAGIAALAAAGQPTREHLDVAAKLLAAIPPRTRGRLNAADGAAQLMFALVLEKNDEARAAELAVLEANRGTEFSRETMQAWLELKPLSRAWALPLVELALPVLRQGKQAARDALIADLTAVAEADRRVTLGEFVLLTFLRQHLREGAGRPVRSQFAKLDEVAADARLVLSMVAHASRGDTAQAFAAGALTLGCAADALVPVGELSTGRLHDALERLRVLAPLVKPRVLRACVDAAMADGGLRLAEAELVRTVAATLDCPLPPVLATLDPDTLRA